MDEQKRPVKHVPTLSTKKRAPLASVIHRRYIVGMVASPYSAEERARLKYTLCMGMEAGIPATECCRQLGIRYRDAMNWRRDDLQFKQAYDEAADVCYQVMADSLLTLHTDVTDPKVAKNVLEARRWWLSKRKPREFGDKLIVEREDDNLVHVLQSAVNRLIDHVAAQSAPALKVIEADGQRVLTRRPSSLDDDPADRHRP
jgi:hypothetical protein